MSVKRRGRMKCDLVTAINKFPQPAKFRNTNLQKFLLLLLPPSICPSVSSPSGSTLCCITTFNDLTTNSESLHDQTPKLGPRLSPSSRISTSSGVHGERTGQSIAAPEQDADEEIEQSEAERGNCREISQQGR